MTFLIEAPKRIHRGKKFLYARLVKPAVPPTLGTMTSQSLYPKY